MIDFLHSIYNKGSSIVMLIHCQAYSIGGGPMAPLVASEVFPLLNRELGMCLAVSFQDVELNTGLIGLQVFWNFVLGAIFILVTPKAMDKIPNGYLGVFVYVIYTSIILLLLVLNS
jgi:hypothetical protein